jgi:hypothetical protein
MKFILIFITAAFRRRRVPMRVLMIAMLIAAWPGMAGATDEMRWLSETSCTQLIAGKAIPAGASEGFVASSLRKNRGGYPRESFDSRAAFGVLLGCVSVFGVRSHDERTGPLEAKGGFEGNEGGQAGRSDGKRV